MLLLCTRHHRLVHEGGYTISLDHNQQRFFRRPDGKAVPHSGYSLDDWQDDYSENVSFEQLIAQRFDPFSDQDQPEKNSREFFRSVDRVDDNCGCYNLH